VLTKADKNAWLNEGIKHVECIYNPSPLHTELRTNINAKNVIAIGRLVEQKGFKVLLRIWSKIASNYPEWNLIIYGQGPLEIPLKSQINESNITNVSIRPFISDVEKIYSNASIIASTSNFEGLPMVLIEAQSSGVPCIAFDCPCGPAEIIDDGKSGYVIPLHDEEMYTTKLKQMLSNDSLLTGFSKQALLNSTQYSIDSISMCWMQLFNRLSNDH
jgi:glycosyltransferase involved in cell wall biosynthesis